MLGCQGLMPGATLEEVCERPSEAVRLAVKAERAMEAEVCWP